MYSVIVHSIVWKLTHIHVHTHRLAGLGPLEELAIEFDRLKNPLEDWLLQKTEAFDALPLVEVSVAELERERGEMEGLGREVREREGEVTRLEELATKFEMDTEVWEMEEWENGEMGG